MAPHSTTVLGLVLCLGQMIRMQNGPLSNKGEEQRPQERLSPAADIVERTPDIATVDKLPEKDTPSPAAGDTQEVTYAQLDHRALTLRAARAVSPQATEPTADSNTYAALARH
ncbi:leukocyte associated immunoglobulin like receptor 1 [Rhinolophus ferrumequinum]|nr:leukocyte associated immunoglobulin like receptor 1 [Rhinolophus ferrumequinum]